MMAVDQRTLDRVEKLLRLAAPTSGTTDYERSTAALEAARLFSEHNMTVAPPKEVKRRVRPRAAPQRRAAVPSPWVNHSPAPPGWAQSVASRDSYCVDPDCRGPIERGDPVWMRLNGLKAEYLHHDWPCGE